MSAFVDSPLEGVLLLELGRGGKELGSSTDWASLVAPAVETS